MRIFFTLFFAISFLPHIYAQKAKNFPQVAQTAYVIYRLAEKYHIQPRPLDDHFSEDVWNAFIHVLDEEKLYFTDVEIASLRKYTFQIDDEIKSRKYNFLETATAVFVDRLKYTDTVIHNILKKPFNYKLKETFSVAEDTSYAKDDKTWREKIRKTLKEYVLAQIVKQIPNPSQKQIDSLEVVCRRKAEKVYRRNIQKILNYPTGIPEEMGDCYCEAVASAYDPHTNYLSLSQKEDMESELGQRPMLFGFSLENDGNDIATIAKLVPGSVAYKSGQINVGDKIMKIQWENKDIIDVSDASSQEISEILGTNNHLKLTLYIKKPDGSERSVTLIKTVNTEEEGDDNKVKSFLLKGDKTVGYISLPAFYKDWEHEENVDGCANDVAKEIIQLKKENIDALILDVRYNGGGSVSEAAEMAGIFIDLGPVGMIRTKNEKPLLLKDINRGTVYDGPLLYMMNGYSASASEIVGAALQDYNRALIVGSKSYGKATGQMVIPVDTTINIEQYKESAIENDFLKITCMKLYRVNGNTAQFTGVVPDVILPDMIELDPHREANEPNALPPDKIEGNKYYRPYGPLPKLQDYIDQEMKKSHFFTQLNKRIIEQQNRPKRFEIPLNIHDYISQIDENEMTEDSIVHDKPLFVVSNNAFEQEKIQLNADTKEINEEWKIGLANDPYLQMVYRLALKMIP